MNKYIPHEELGKLNRVAIRNHKNALASDSPAFANGYSLPIVLALSGIDQAGWVRCMVPVQADCTQHAFIDIRSEEFDRLPIIPDGGDSLQKL